MKFHRSKSSISYTDKDWDMVRNTLDATEEISQMMDKRSYENKNSAIYKLMDK